MNEISIEVFANEVSQHTDLKMSNRFKKGCINCFQRCVKRDFPNDIQEKGGIVYLPDKLITREYIDKYLEKSSNDMSAKDCAHIALNHVGTPPDTEMSISSLERLIRKIIISERSIRDSVYFKYKKGNPIYCVDYNTACLIASQPEVVNRIQVQTRKADQKHRNTVEFRAYEFEKEKIACLDALNAQENNSRIRSLSTSERTNLMVKAIFGMLFADFDFDKYVEYLDEMNILYDNWEFGKRYQELYDIFHAPHYKYEFYKNITKDEFLEILADKVAEKIVDKIKQ